MLTTPTLLRIRAERLDALPVLRSLETDAEPPLTAAHRTLQVASGGQDAYPHALDDHDSRRRPRPTVPRSTGLRPPSADRRDADIADIAAFGGSRAVNATLLGLLAVAAAS